MTTKACFKCLEVKPMDGFYRHSKMSDGHLNKCKSCTKVDVLNHRNLNLVRVRAYDRSRGSLPHRIKARAEYAKTEAYAISHAASSMRWIKQHPERDKAHLVVSNAVRDGSLVAWPVCAIAECCGKPHGHHPDYSRPLDVVWLCPLHHKQAHEIVRQENFLAA